MGALVLAQAVAERPPMPAGVFCAALLVAAFIGAGVWELLAGRDLRDELADERTARRRAERRADQLERRLLTRPTEVRR